MSMMADLAASEGLGYGQALTASEMAINAGSKTCLLLRLPLLIVCQLLKSSKKCVYIYKFLRFGAINDTSDVPISVVSRLSFRCCLFSGLAMGPSMATLALAANWNYFEISLTGAACALLSAALSAFALRDVPHASGTWKKAPQTHRRTDQRGKQRKTCPNTSKTCFHPKKHVSKNKKTQTQQSENLHFQKQNTSKKRWSAVLIFLRRREDRKRCRALGVARAGREKREHKKKHETRTNPPKILMFRWFWRVFLCFVDFVCFLCVFLCFLWFLDFHRQLQMRVFLLVLEEVKWRGLAAWAYKSSLRFLDVHDFFVWHKNALWCTLLLCWVRWVL